MSLLGGLLPQPIALGSQALVLLIFLTFRGTLSFIRVFSFQPAGEDELKKMQLMELAIINGTYRDSKQVASIARKSRFMYTVTRKY